MSLGDPSDSDKRRHKAEKCIQVSQPLTERLPIDKQTKRLLHELQVHQVELETQNAELMESRQEVAQRKADHVDFYDFSPIGFVSLDRNGTIVEINLAAAQLLNVARGHLPGNRLAPFLALVGQHALEAGLRELFRNTLKQTWELVLPEKTGPARTLQMVASLSRDEQSCLAVLIDITERKQVERELQLAASVFSYSSEGIIVTDAVGVILKVNDAFSLITGYRREEALGQNLRFLDSGRHGLEFSDAMWREVNEKDHWNGEMWNRRKNGEVYAAMQTLSAVRDISGGIQNYVVQFSDITQRMDQQQLLEHSAHYDPLTKLPNRELLGIRLRQGIAQSQRRRQSLAVVFMDLDGFKAVNDVNGHHVGDELLAVLGQRLKAVLREGDTLGRVGGDEFVAVLVDLEKTQDCIPLLERMLRAAAAPVPVGDTEFRVSASIGITFSPQDGSEPELLIHQADMAMYQAKKGGGNSYRFFNADQVHL